MGVHSFDDRLKYVCFENANSIKLYAFSDQKHRKGPAPDISMTMWQGDLAAGRAPRSTFQDFMLIDITGF